MWKKASMLFPVWIFNLAVMGNWEISAVEFPPGSFREGSEEERKQGGKEEGREEGGEERRWGGKEVGREEGGEKRKKVGEGRMRDGKLRIWEEHNFLFLKLGFY